MSFIKSGAKYSKQEFEDLGLGEKAPSGGYRSLNKDGSFNVRKINIPIIERLSFFHSLVTMSWIRFFCVLLIGYFSVNSIFATLYVIIGVEHLTGIESTSLSFFKICLIVWSPRREPIWLTYCAWEPFRSMRALTDGA